MIISSKNDVSSAYAAASTLSNQQQTVSSNEVNSTDDISSNSSYNDKVTISDAAKAMIAESQATANAQEIQKRLDAIKAKPAVQRSSDEVDFVSKNDKRLAKLVEKGWDSLNSEEADYMQKATGFVNTMSMLSPKEKGLYDELIGQNNREAANALLLVGMSRIGMEGQQVTLPNGLTFDPTKTDVTAENIRNLFKHIFAGDSSNTDRTFDVLASYLDQRENSNTITDKA